MTVSIAPIGAAAVKNASELRIRVPAGGVPAGAVIVLCALGGIYFPELRVSDPAGNLYHNAPSATTIAYAVADGALLEGDEIVVTAPGSPWGAMAVSASYATGVTGSPDPTYQALAGQAGGNPGSAIACAVAAPAVPGSLVIAALGTYGPASDYFSQDAAWPHSLPRIGTSGGKASTNRTSAGAAAVLSGPAAYAPSAGGSRGWFISLAGFPPA